MFLRCPNAVDALEACAGLPSRRSPHQGPPPVPQKCQPQVLRLEACLVPHQALWSEERGERS